MAKTAIDYALRTYTASASSLFSTRFSNDFRFNYSTNATTSNTIIDGFGGGRPIDLNQLLGSYGLMYFSYNGYTAVLMDGHSPGAQKQWNFVDAVALSLGRHQLKLGAD